jgi:hypothetical protein
MARDFDDFIKALRWWNENFHRQVLETITKACLKVEAKAKEYAPHKTGQLRRSIHTRIESERLTGKVGTNLIYAAPLEFGAKITPKRAKSLFIPLDRKTRSLVARYGGVRKFISAVGGKVVYRKGRGKCGKLALVYSKGELLGRFCVAKKATIEPREFFKRAYEEVKKEFPSLVFKKYIAKNPYI